MNLADIVQSLGLEACAGANRLAEKKVTGGYACDLLSYVMAKAKEGDLWLTVQGHPNIVAVASLVNLAGVIVTEGAKIDPATLEKANQEGVPILTTPLTTYELAGRLYELGVK
ncbi:MAG: DRTGG domain-containing protein [Anaerolineae bacterium]|nr:DRTGG domain-containing protein [Anaerolineae bacterium]